MKKIIYPIIIFLFFIGSANAEWLACDIPDPAQDVVSSAVVLDGAPEVIVPYELNVAGDAVKLWDVSGLDTATFEVWFINSQGRRSDFDPAVEGDHPVPFALKAKPSASTIFQIIQE